MPRHHKSFYILYHDFVQGVVTTPPKIDPIIPPILMLWVLEDHEDRGEPFLSIEIFDVTKTF